MTFEQQTRPPGRAVAVSAVDLAGLAAAGLGFALVLSLLASRRSPVPAAEPAARA